MFLSKTNRGETTYYYEEITSVIETKRDIYLMLGKNLGIPIEKAKCTPQAIEFLRTLKSPA
ncbi:YcxB family protein [Streptococcus hyointestinalis]|uniref:YcxB family protein n=1 Tax=Streptococcus hyointestinalis TaxID=1337 RepID=UPI003D03B3E6